jgi:hypothetical protein
LKCRIFSGTNHGQIPDRESQRDNAAQHDGSGEPNMNRNSLYLVIGVLAAAALVAGYLLYQEQQKTSGITIDLGKDSISIETK